MENKLTREEQLAQCVRSFLYLCRNDKRNIVKIVSREARDILGAQGLNAQGRCDPRTALELCVQELEAAHTKYYPGCHGGCPSCEAVDAAKSALGRTRIDTAHSFWEPGEAELNNFLGQLRVLHEKMRKGGCPKEVAVEFKLLIAQLPVEKCLTA